MIPLISPAAMRECEQRYFRMSGEASIDVMERAARALADVISAELPEGSTIHFACGTGGNGGDGTACARLLHEKYRCIIVQPKEPTAPDAIENLRRAKEYGIPVVQSPGFYVSAFTGFPLPKVDRLPNPDAWVDALFGTGLSRPPEGVEKALIHYINAQRSQGARVYSADIPSGLNGTTGNAHPACIEADCTVTFQHIKTGMALGDGMDACGKIIRADVGFPQELFFTPEINMLDAGLLEPADITRWLSPRPRNIHKGSCGHLLIVAGSFGMAGAAAMCAQAALRSGVGLLTIACVKSIVPMLQTLVPQAMCIPLEEDRGAISIDALPALQAALVGKTAAVIGPGLTKRVPEEIIRAVLKSDIPAVIDADALNIMAFHPILFGMLKKHHVITPHPGEAARLLDSAKLFDNLRALSEPGADPEELSRAFNIALGNLSLSDSYNPTVPESPVEAASALQKLGATALYKGASCVISDGDQVYVSRSGCCGMARGGSGDILCGILGAMLAEKSTRAPSLTAALASEIHGLAGELAQVKYGSRSMNALDIVEFLPEVFPK